MAYGLAADTGSRPIWGGGKLHFIRTHWSQGGNML